MCFLFSDDEFSATALLSESARIKKHIHRRHKIKIHSQSDSLFINNLLFCSLIFAALTDDKPYRCSLQS